jgi:hypothetical protein
LMDAKWTFTRRKTSNIFQCASVGAPHKALSKFIVYLFTVHGGHCGDDVLIPIATKRGHYIATGTVFSQFSDFLSHRKA